MIDSPEMEVLWPTQPDGLKRCSVHPQEPPFVRVAQCGECCREVHVCPLPDGLEWPAYWRDYSNVYAYVQQPPVFECSYHPHNWFRRTEACRHCVEADSGETENGNQ